MFALTSIDGEELKGGKLLADSKSNILLGDIKKGDSQFEVSSSTALQSHPCTPRNRAEKDPDRKPEQSTTSPPPGLQRWHHLNNSLLHSHADRAGHPKRS